jgi:RsiW-degrading membrane proteinase PrsW (M82 family)
MHILDFLPSFSGAVAVLPALLLVWVLASADRRPEPARIVWLTFALGVASIFLLRYARLPLTPLLHLGNEPWERLVSWALFAVAIPEETVKVAVIAFMIFVRRKIEPMDGVVIGAAAGLGFAAHENLSYFARNNEEWQMFAITRNVLTVPFHGALGIIAGSIIETARLSYRAGAPALRVAGLMVLALAAPVLWHALYDLPFLAMQFHVVRGQSLLLAQGCGILVGAAAMIYAIDIAVRRNARQRPLAGYALAQWRCVSTLLTAATGAGLFGAALVAGSLHLWLRSGQKLPFDSLGVGLSLVAFAAYWSYHANSRIDWGRSGRHRTVSAFPAS